MLLFKTNNHRILLNQLTAVLLLGRPVSKTEAFSLQAFFLALISSAAALRDTINTRVREADIEQWYERLKDVTYKTIYCPISLEEGKAMVRRWSSLKS